MKIIKQDRLIPETETTRNISPIEAPTAFHPRGTSELRPFIEALCDLIDFVSQNETRMPVPLTEIEYRELAARLDDLLDLVNGEESHPLAPLLHFVGTLIMIYEDEHIPKLTEL